MKIRVSFDSRNVLSLSFSVLFSVLWLVLVIGWILNLVKIFSLEIGDTITVEVIMRIIGIIIPFFGGIYGYM